MKQTIYFIAIATALLCMRLDAQELKIAGSFNVPACYSYEKAIPEMIQRGEMVFFPNNAPVIRSETEWEPAVAEIYSKSETEPDGNRTYLLGKDGRIEKQISMYYALNDEGYYDYTSMSIGILNHTYTTPDADWFDTVYYYNNDGNGHFIPNMKVYYSYHYFDKTAVDSFYFEQVIQMWDAVKTDWKNYSKSVYGYHDTLVEFQDRVSDYIYGADNKWKLQNYFYDSIIYDHQGFVTELFMNRIYEAGPYHTPSKIIFTNDDQGRYTHATYYEKKGDNWVMIPNHPEFDNIVWKEWNGFTYSSMSTIGIEMTSPYKRTKIHSKDVYINGDKKFVERYQWDIEGTKSNSDSTYHFVDNQLYPASTIENIYNEYGDYVEWLNTAYSYPDGEGMQLLTAHNAHYNAYEYLTEYGMSEKMSYLLALQDGKIDTTFIDGIKIKSYQPVSIMEVLPTTKQSLRIAPNPATNYVRITADESILQLEIFDLIGRRLRTQTEGGNEAVIALEAFPKGIYIIKALLKNGSIQTTKLVVK